MRPPIPTENDHPAEAAKLITLVTPAQMGRQRPDNVPRMEPRSCGGAADGEVWGLLFFQGQVLLIGAVAMQHFDD
jgi:hypothetical protein